MNTEKTGYPPSSQPNKRGRKGKAVVVTLLSLLGAGLITVVVLAILLLQDTVSHNYSVNPSLDALTKAVVELGVKDELTLTPQEMTDTVGYFMNKEVVRGHIRFRHVYFDVAEDQENALLIIPFQYDNIDLVLQLNTSIAVREQSDGQGYFSFTINQAKVGELVIPTSFVETVMKSGKKGEHVTFADGEIRVDESFLALDVNGQKITFQVRELSVTPEGFRVQTESLSDFLMAVISGLFSPPSE